MRACRHEMTYDLKQGDDVIVVCTACGIDVEDPEVVAAALFDALHCLAMNLAVGGALCEAWDIALHEAEQHALYHAHGYRLGGCWSPGCRRSA